MYLYMFEYAKHFWIFIFLTVIYIFVELVMCNSFFNMTTAI